MEVEEVCPRHLHLGGEGQVDDGHVGSGRLRQEPGFDVGGGAREGAGGRPGAVPQVIPDQGSAAWTALYQLTKTEGKCGKTVLHGLGCIKPRNFMSSSSLSPALTPRQAQLRNLIFC